MHLQPIRRRVAKGQRQPFVGFSLYPKPKKAIAKLKLTTRIRLGYAYKKRICVFTTRF